MNKKIIVTNKEFQRIVWPVLKKSLFDDSVKNENLNKKPVLVVQSGFTKEKDKIK